MAIGPFSGRGVLLLNNKPFAFLDRGGAEQVFIPSDALKGGANVIQIALLPGHGDGEGEQQAAYDQLSKGVTILECIASVSAK